MATKDEKPGLLFKVAMFVRNPTRDWSELDQPAESESAGYDKQALKAMIERKRQNDFVRKREFDQLHKFRNRDPATLASMARPSFFQSSVFTDIDDRAVTLKKIDEIEAQMSRQWWKARSPDSQGSTVPPAAPGASPHVQPEAPEDAPKASLVAADMSIGFASTELMPQPTETADEGNDFVATQSNLDDASVPYGSRAAGRDAKAGSGNGFSHSDLFAVDEMATDPELEEAAVRFANGDVTGAESGLLTALRGNDLELQAAQSWAAALLDLYRATGNRESFENAANEFALHLGGGWPVWTTLSGAPSQPSSQEAVSVTSSRPVWEAPATLDAEAMEHLRSALVDSPMPWHLGWGALQNIEPKTMPLLDALFDSLCTEHVSLRLDGQDQLVRALRVLTPSGDATVDHAWWQVRLDALRALSFQDDFELAALDYCITFEASPLEWKPAACKVLAAGEVQPAQEQMGAGQAATLGSAPSEALEETALVLTGEILGDATQALLQLDSAAATSHNLLIDCSALMRVDFAAAGSMLNWVTARQSEGKQIQFQSVHRLVAAFFNVIGINEYAQVKPRAI